MKTPNKILIISLIFFALLYTVCRFRFEPAFANGVFVGYLLGSVNFYSLARKVLGLIEGRASMALIFNGQIRLLGTGFCPLARDDEITIEHNRYAGGALNYTRVYTIFCYIRKSKTERLTRLSMAHDVPREGGFTAGTKANKGFCLCERLQRNVRKAFL